MSAPGLQMQQAENLDYGFLAARATEVIQKKLSGDLLAPNEAETLDRARKFLLDVVQGASLVSGDKFNGHSSQVVTALRYAANPVATIQDVISSDKEFGEYFEHLADALVDTNIDEERLDSAKNFFDAMLQSLKKAMSQSRPPSIGSLDHHIAELKQIG